MIIINEQGNLTNFDNVVEIYVTDVRRVKSVADVTGDNEESIKLREKMIEKFEAEGYVNSEKRNAYKELLYVKEGFELQCSLIGDGRNSDYYEPATLFFTKTKEEADALMNHILYTYRNGDISVCDLNFALHEYKNKLQPGTLIQGERSIPI